ncbi:acyl-CoA desaturase [Pseudomonadales bacterium]|nr:acyl-CoA desaturase [Pseudomonadales bacterium]
MKQQQQHPTPRRFDVLAIFTSTSLVAALGVPWHGITHGYHPGLWVLLGLMLAWNGLSITAGYHRLWSHKAYSAHLLPRLIFALGGALAVQNSIRNWCADHRNHHRHTDDPDLDPYSSRRGLWYSHMGWMLRDYPATTKDYSNITDLDRDPVVVWQHKHYATLALSLNLLLPLALGWLFNDPMGGLLLLGFFRLVIGHHTTFLINSLAHAWGSQPYSDQTSSRDNPLIALLTYGEGYHNFHHTFQWDYRNGVRWYHFDPTKWLIKALSWCQLAHHLKQVAPEKIEQSRAKMQLAYASARVRQSRPSNKEQWLNLLEAEYEQLVHSLNAWALCRQRKLELKTAKLKQRWDETELHHQLQELESNLNRQRRHWRLLTQQFA